MEPDDVPLAKFGLYDQCSVQLLVVMFDFSKANIKDVVFDLFWGYPITGKDYLDGSALAYSKTTHVSTIDYMRTGNISGITHSGDVMDDAKSVGHHTINANLATIASNVTQIFFTLSAYNSPTISVYPNPTVSLFDKAQPKVELCPSFSIQKAANSQAVIMCCLTRSTQGWLVEQLGVLSPGNAKKYNRINQTIASLPILQKN